VVPPDSTWEAVTGGTAENRITSLQLGQSLNDAIRSGFLRDDLLEAVIVLPSGIFYGNNVPACLAIINKRKPNARKDRVLMIWASRHYQHANPQSFLRRADCLRILLPWRAFGDAAIP
jgi:type I restriction enzyme M protein